jgi:drug/metabolite transporter (DMT)-like permease
MSDLKRQIINTETIINDKSKPLIKEFDGIISTKSENKPNNIYLNSNKENKNEEINIKKSMDEKIEERISATKNTFKNERLGFSYCLCAQFLWTLNSVYLKFLTLHYHTTFKNKTFLFARGFATMIICYCLGNYFDGKIYKITEFNSQIKKCILIRANVSFFRMSFWLVAIYYLRISTCQIISTLSPIIIIFFSVIFLNEKYHSRYAIGIILGILGSSIIVLNEKKIVSNKKDSSLSEVFIGIISILCNISLAGVIGVANKIMANNKISIYTQMFYLGIFHCFYSFLWMLFTMDFDYTFIYFILCMLQAVLFFLGNFFNYSGLKMIDLSKTSLLQYTKIVFVFILSSLLLNEKIFLSDIFGSCIIVSFMIYHVINPIK